MPASGDDQLDAWVYMPDQPSPVPVVVMALGIGGIKAGGLAPFAQRFASSGFAAVAFDYRHWGDSTGEPRQFLSVHRQLQDYRSALAWVRTQAEFDAARMFVWGTSFAGMHIVELAAGEPGLAGAIAQCPLVDGVAGLTNISAARALRLTAHALADLAGSVFNRRPRYLPISVPPGQLGVIATDDAMVGMARLDPGDGSWSNEITARSLLDVTVHRPVETCPMPDARCPMPAAHGRGRTRHHGSHSTGTGRGRARASRRAISQPRRTLRRLRRRPRPRQRIAGRDSLLTPALRDTRPLRQACAGRTLTPPRRGPPSTSS
jgi:uncharacterized protein